MESSSLYCCPSSYNRVYSYVAEINEKNTSVENKINELADHCFQVIGSEEKSHALKIIMELFQSIEDPLSNPNLSAKAQFCIATKLPITKSLDFFKLSAAKEFAWAENEVALYHRYGWGAPQNELMTFKYYERSAKKENAIGQYGLAECYLDGFGVVKDKVQAFNNYELSAKQGYAMAQSRLGDCYHYGLGTEKNQYQAYINYELSANQGNVRSLDQLAKFYEIGMYVGQSTVKAEEYRNLASNLRNGSDFGKLVIKYSQ